MVKVLHSKQREGQDFLNEKIHDFVTVTGILGNLIVLLEHHAPLNDNEY